MCFISLPSPLTEDYIPTTGTYITVYGQCTCVTIELMVIDDDVFEPDPEDFIIQLSTDDNTTTISPDDDTTPVVIIDDDSVQFQIAQIAYNVFEAHTVQVCLEIVEGTLSVNVVVEFLCTSTDITAGSKLQSLSF